MLSVPFLSLTFGPKVAVPLAVLLGTALDIMLFAGCYKHADLKKALHLFSGAIIGLPFGVYVLSALSGGSLRTLIGAVTIILALILSLGIRKHFRRERLASMGAGLISGALKGSTGMLGPPVILLGLNQDWPQVLFRSTIIAYFTLVSLCALPVLAGFGLLTEHTVKLSFAGLPALLLGLAGGTKLRSRVSHAFFRRIALALTMLAGASGICYGLF